VADTGISIPREARDRIFEAFSQADGSTTRRYGGTGLGLAISSQIAALMGGAITVESEPGQGSTFHLTAGFEIADDADTVTVPHAALERLRGVRVLVVDDNATNRRILVDLVRRWGMEPAMADYGPRAMEMARDAVSRGRPYHLVLSDVHMPEMDGFELAGRLVADPDMGRPLVMLLTSAARPGDGDRVRRLGLAGYILKPILPGELQEGIRKALGTVGAEPEGSRRTATGPGAAKRSLRILLAEDNKVNELVAVTLLEKKGHHVDVARNGRVAVERLEAGDYDMVLMDVQMPEMDGLEATRYIRDSEEGTGRHVPIVAMTAHAMKGDRERCLEAGMDDYLSKPIDPDELDAALGRACGPAPAADGPPVFDHDTALAMVGDDEDVLRTLVDMFLAQSQTRVDAVLGAVAAGDSKALQQAGHSLRGTASTLGMGPLSDIALELEQRGADGRAAESGEAAAALEAAMAEVVEALQAFTP
jgi:CheY-like chemotaxis protein